MLVSALIGLGFTFFSGATEAWLVDALMATGYDEPIETVFGKGQTTAGAATLVGTIGWWVPWLDQPGHPLRGAVTSAALRDRCRLPGDARHRLRAPS